MPPPAFSPTRWHRTIAKRLVFDNGVRRHGLNPTQLDHIFLDEKTRQDFLNNYAILSELGSDVFWQLIAEFDDEERASAEQAQSASATTADPAAASVTGITSLERPTAPVTKQARKDSSRTPNHARLKSQPRSRGLKRTQSLAAHQTVEADERLQDSAAEHSSRNKKAKRPTTANASSGRPLRQCSGWFELNGECVLCERMFKNQASWVKHWNDCHVDLPMVKPQFEHLTIVPDDPAPYPGDSTLTQAANNLNAPEVNRTQKVFQNGTAASPHQSDGNQPQPCPAPLHIETRDNNPEAGAEGQNNANGSDFTTKSKTEGHAPEVPFPQAAAAHFNSQSANTDMTYPVHFNSDCAFGLNCPLDLNISPNAVPGFDLFDQNYNANESDGWDENHTAGPSSWV